MEACATQSRAAGAALVLTGLFGLSGAPLAGPPEPPGPPEALHSDSRAPYVHRLTLYDHEGRAIDPTDELAPPYSPRMTCGKCHPYAEISHGWHFNAPDPNVPPGRPGEPWLLVDERTGTVLPISARRWAGTYAPAAVGLTDWEFVLHFGRHIPGGGLGEPAAEVVRVAPEKARWGVSGLLEIDCMFCHSVGQQHDPAEAARQIEKQNFKWAPTVALGLAVVRGEARKVPDDWDPLTPPNPDYPEQAGPRLVYDRGRFDADDRVLFDITRRPPPERCYFCHMVREVGPGSPERWQMDQDVHLAAGLTCVDCHRNGVDHAITRGCEGEVNPTTQPAYGSLTCRGCHLGEADVADIAIVLGGWLAAPQPEHRGLPPVHFEKLTCTACHSGSWPEMTAKQFQTALAHGLGLATRERTPADPPRITGPVFAWQDGKIAPQRLVWPAFWGRLDKNEIRPIPPAVVDKVVKAVLSKPATKEHFTAEPLSRASILKVLESLAADKQAEGVPVYVLNGSVQRRSLDGKLETVSHAAGRPYLWPLAHDVRPAGQSLGIRGCQDCHASAAPLYFGRIAVAGDAAADVRPIGVMHELRGDEMALARAWALGFKLRPAFKWFAFICAGLIALVLLRFALEHVGGGALINGPAAQTVQVPPPTPRGLTRFEHVFHTLAGAALVIQALTGFGPLLVGAAVRGWPLFVHLLGAPLFIAGLAGIALQWAGRCRCGATGLTVGQKALFWIALVPGFVVLLTMLAAMAPMAGSAPQEILTAVHKYAALLLVIAVVVHTFVSLAARRARGKLQ